MIPELPSYLMLQLEAVGREKALRRMRYFDMKPLTLMMLRGGELKSEGREGMGLGCSSQYSTLRSSISTAIAVLR